MGMELPLNGAAPSPKKILEEKEKIFCKAVFTDCLDSQSVKTWRLAIHE